MYKSKFTLSDDTEEFEGYTDGSLWNGWANVCFTREQVIDFLDGLPYEWRFVEGNLAGSPQLVIYWDEMGEFYPSTPLPTDDGHILVGYFLDGLEFMEVVDEAD